ncbi:hypothetical protein LZ318_24865 [Saccharopolyspora indica]|uniref:hypothetical protein n=1 Tax=Saccharopolyspora indica TaxID=1229659 RepID=UPI0022EB3B81|nr:hypothetical protein [Saccharopolyspora indica]MDA3649897.1 hypothetical protein [Saccharopolyspora indica]
MTAFDVNHNGYLEVNEQLLQSVRTLGTILEQLNTGLKNIPEASWGQAQPIWLESQRQWDRSYQQMTERINLTSVSSINIHEIFRNGDQQGARIFGQ